MSEEEKKGSGFQVKDRRRFTEQGEHRAADGTSPGAAKASEPPPADGRPQERSTGEQEKERAERGARRRDPSAPLPDIDFPTFVLSLSSSVVIHLGLAPDPVSGERVRDLGLAKQTIDILGMLQEKTRGNLSGEEKNLMEGILYDLRLRYVEESKKQ